MLLAHLSDPHVMSPDDPVAGFVDTRARLAAAVAALAALPEPPDVTLLTGDLVNRGTDEEYALLRQVLVPLPGRLLVVPGNHDDREGMRRAFPELAELWTEPGHLSCVVDDEELRLVGLDTTVPGRDDGELDAERLDWLGRVLAGGPARDTVLFLHHPPYSAGMWWMDYGGLKGAHDLRDLLSRHPEVVRVLAGHVHRTTSVSWGTTVLSTAPSSFYATTAPTGGVEVPEVIDVPAAIPVLRWDAEDAVLVATELEPPGEHARLAFPTVIGDGWPEYAARARAGAEMPAHR